jgi:poly(A) polymerase
LAERASPLEVRVPYLIPTHRLDADAVDIVRRLREAGHIAYLVGGCLRDLYVGLPPKDFDIATSARPNQVKRLFRTCRIIGRRFRLAHVHVRGRIVEVSTFRGMAQDDVRPGSRRGDPRVPETVFGTPEEDALRRDFTINGLFYDVDTAEIIDYVGGLTDLRRKVIRCIGDPEVRFQEDPVRMIRALKLAARVDFALDPPLVQAISRQHALIRQSAPARILEELFKILGSGAASRTLSLLAEHRLLAPLLPEVNRALLARSPAGESLVGRYLDALDAADQGRRMHSNPVLIASMLLPVLDPDSRLFEPVAGGPGGPDRFHPDDLADRVGRMLHASPVLRHMSRRDAYHVGAIVALQRALARAAPAHAAARIAHTEAFPDALALFAIASDALALDLGVLAGWRDLAARYAPAPRRGRDDGRGPGWDPEDMPEIDFEESFDGDGGRAGSPGGGGGGGGRRIGRGRRRGRGRSLRSR